MKILALIGRAGSGKDTAAYMLQLLTGAVEPYWGHIHAGVLSLNHYLDARQEHGTGETVENWPILKFAWPVYQIAGILTGHDPEDILSSTGFKSATHEWGLTGRQLLQKIGTECFRQVISDRIWMDIMLRKLVELRGNNTTGVIISDLRFLNESVFLQRERATIIRITGRDSGVPATHQSESEIDSLPADFTVNNNGEYKELMDCLHDICVHKNILNCKYRWK